MTALVGLRRYDNTLCERLRLAAVPHDSYSGRLLLSLHEKAFLTNNVAMKALCLVAVALAFLVVPLVDCAARLFRSRTISHHFEHSSQTDHSCSQDIKDHLRSMYSFLPKAFSYCQGNTSDLFRVRNSVTASEHMLVSLIRGSHDREFVRTILREHSPLTQDEMAAMPIEDRLLYRLGGTYQRLDLARQMEDPAYGEGPARDSFALAAQRGDLNLIRDLLNPGPHPTLVQRTKIVRTFLPFAIQQGGRPDLSAEVKATYRQVALVLFIRETDANNNSWFMVPAPTRAAVVREAVRTQHTELMLHILGRRDLYVEELKQCVDELMAQTANGTFDYMPTIQWLLDGNHNVEERNTLFSNWIQNPIWLNAAVTDRCIEMTRRILDLHPSRPLHDPHRYLRLDGYTNHLNRAVTIAHPRLLRLLLESRTVVTRQELNSLVARIFASPNASHRVEMAQIVLEKGGLIRADQWKVLIEDTMMGRGNAVDMLRTASISLTATGAIVREGVWRREVFERWVHQPEGLAHSDLLEVLARIQPSIQITSTTLWSAIQTRNVELVRLLFTLGAAPEDLQMYQIFQTQDASQRMEMARMAVGKGGRILTGEDWKTLIRDTMMGRGNAIDILRTALANPLDDVARDITWREEAFVKWFERQEGLAHVDLLEVLAQTQPPIQIPSNRLRRVIDTGNIALIRLAFSLGAIPEGSHMNRIFSISDASQRMEIVRMAVGKGGRIPAGENWKTLIEDTMMGRGNAADILRTALANPYDSVVGEPAWRQEAFMQYLARPIQTSAEESIQLEILGLLARTQPAIQITAHRLSQVIATGNVALVRLMLDLGAKVTAAHIAQAKVNALSGSILVGLLQSHFVNPGEMERWIEETMTGSADHTAEILARIQSGWTKKNYSQSLGLFSQWTKNLECLNHLDVIEALLPDSLADVDRSVLKSHFKNMVSGHTLFTSAACLGKPDIVASLLRILEKALGAAPNKGPHPIDEILDITSKNPAYKDQTAFDIAATRKDLGSLQFLYRRTPRFGGSPLSIGILKPTNTDLDAYLIRLMQAVHYNNLWIFTTPSWVDDMKEPSVKGAYEALDARSCEANADRIETSLDGKVTLKGLKTWRAKLLTATTVQKYPAHPEVVTMFIRVANDIYGRFSQDAITEKTVQVKKSSKEVEGSAKATVDDREFETVKQANDNGKIKVDRAVPYFFGVVS